MEMMGKTVAHYKILEKIGEGGMGVVYKAEDTKLKRTVALKFLPPELTRDAQAKARFVQEAQAAAALDHPNICAVFEIGGAEGATFIAMPHVKGQSLKERIASGPLSVDEAMTIAAQVAEGLKEAHEKGIIHRDIKPANIMLTEKGQAKIMDFGLAKLEAGADLTRTMAVMGTAAYMSPEQARGEDVDHRTDIWSFGATLYEMLTGQKPFGQKHDQALIYSILNDTSESVSRIRPEIPKPLDGIIQKALEKDRSRRYQSMGELIKDLKSAGSSGLSVFKTEKSIVVLPFEDISPGKDNEYFCDGITEEIITDLSQIGGLRVISRTSAMMLKSTPKSIGEIAEMLHVQYVLEGSVRKAGNSLRVAAQLIDANTDAHLWADKYSGTLDDVFDIQEKVSRAIVRALRFKLTAAQDRKIAKRPINNVQAYEFYLRARSFYLRLAKEGYDEAAQILETGLKATGDNALLCAALGFVHEEYVRQGIKKEHTLLIAERYARQALDLDPDTPLAHVVLGIVYGLRGYWRDAYRSWKTALLLDPNDSEVLQWALWVYAAIGRTAEGFPFAERILEKDPLNPAGYIMGILHFYEGQFDRAVEIWRRYYHPMPVVGRWFLAYYLVYAKCEQEALGILEPIKEISTFDVNFQNCRFLRYVLRGESHCVPELLTDDYLAAVKRDAIVSCRVATLYVMLGDKERALDWLENSVNRGSINYPYMSEYDPFLAKLRGEVRFQKLMERVKYEWEHFEV